MTVVQSKRLLATKAEDLTAKEIQDEVIGGNIQNFQAQSDYKGFFRDRSPL